MKLDVSALRYLSLDDFKVLEAVEKCMHKHDRLLPYWEINNEASLKHGGTYKILKNLLKHKLLHHEYDEYRLTYLGYDFLAIKAMVNSGVFVAVGRQIGVGKESDIFEVVREDDTILAMKLHRLGRVSFRAVKSKRDYVKHRGSGSNTSWLYLSAVAAQKEFKFMKALEDHDFPVPHAVSRNRHCVVMSLVQGYPLAQVRQLQNPEVVFQTIIDIIIRLAEHGLIHCDFNEFNIMIDDDEEVTMIDFPQMVSISHHNGQMYFDRDVECIFKFFRKRFNLSFEESKSDNGAEVDGDESARPSYASINKDAAFLDKELAASGYSKRSQEFASKDQECVETEKEDGEEEEEGLVVDGSDAELTKRLNKERRKAISAARRGQRNLACRNSSKEKGGRTFHNSKT